MHRMHRTFRRAPDDADPPIFSGFEADIEMPATLYIKGRQFDVTLQMLAVGSHYGEEVLIDGPVTVVTSTGASREVKAPWGTNKSAREYGQTGFTAELSDAVAKWIDDHFHDIDMHCRWSLS